MIQDPTDDRVAIDPKTSRLAAQVFFVKEVADVTAPTVEELRDATFVGWTSPDIRDDEEG